MSLVLDATNVVPLTNVLETLLVEARDKSLNLQISRWTYNADTPGKWKVALSGRRASGKDDDLTASLNEALGKLPSGELTVAAKNASWNAQVVAEMILGAGAKLNHFFITADFRTDKKSAFKVQLRKQANGHSYGPYTSATGSDLVLTLTKALASIDAL